MDPLAKYIINQDHQSLIELQKEISDKEERIGQKEISEL